jgi:putative ABC transport system permease protein
MFKEHIKFAFRNLAKQKVYSLINLFGLTTGLACFLLIALYIFDELTFDRFHQQHGSIYRVIEDRTSKEGKQSRVVSTAYNVSAASRNSVPGVEAAARYSMIGRSNVTEPESKNVFYESFFLADRNFLKMFDFPVISGNTRTALDQPYSVVLTEETAKKYFGNTNVVGKALLTERDSLPYRVTAVIRIPANSHLKFNLLFSESNLEASKEFMAFANADWTSNSFITYIQLKGDVNGEAVQDKITRLVAQHRTGAEAPSSRFTLQPLDDIHFYSAGIEGDLDQQGNIMHMYVFGIVAFFVLLIACINYMNLTTARFSGRSKEIAVRKVSGATQGNLVKQFLTEASLMTVIALLLALLAVNLALPKFNAFTQKDLELGLNADWRIWMGVVGVVIIVGLLSGIYPAFFQARLKPYLLLKSRAPSGKGNLSMRRVLVVVQFSLSIIMIVSTLVVYRQLKYVDSKDMGFNKEGLLVVDINSGMVRRSAQTIKTEFSKIPSVLSVSASSRVPGEWKVIPKVKLRTEGAEETKGEEVFFMSVDDRFMETFQVKLVSGRNFSPAQPSDSSAILLNETAAKMVGISHPSEQMVEIPSIAFSGNASALRTPFKARVIGIVKDFNYQSLREKVAPLVLGHEKNPVHNIDYFTARIATGNVEATLALMKSVLSAIDDDHLFEYNFLDRQWDLFYMEDQKRQMIFLAVALLTILIACLGLFGLATYAAEQRIKEIGIRKVLGASVVNLVGLLTKDFLVLVLVSALIAFPVAWWAMHTWLQDFAFRINIGWSVFLLAGLAATLIALGTISFQAIRAALSNPVKNLRTE